MEDIQPNINHVTDRRATTGKRHSDIAPSEWPVVTPVAYQQLFRGSVDGMDLKLRQLCMGRVRLHQTLLALDTLIRPLQKESPTSEMHRRLVSIRKTVERDFLRYPLNIK